MHVGYVLCKLVGFLSFMVNLDLNILACILLWIELDSLKHTLEERPGTALYCSVSLMAIMPSYIENIHHVRSHKNCRIWLVWHLGKPEQVGNGMTPCAFVLPNFSMWIQGYTNPF